MRLLGEGAEDQRLPLDLRGALLAYLAYADCWLPREQVAFLFWPDTDETSARRNLRQLLNRTKALELTQPLEFQPGLVRWPVESDVAQLRLAVGRQRWDRVVELYGGDLLAGRPAAANAGFGAWLELERDNLRNTYRRAAVRRAEELETGKEHSAAAALLEPLLSSDDLAEEVLQAYMRNAYLAGLRQEALDAYELFARRLADEMELEPLEETQRLAGTVRSAVPLAGAAPRTPRTPPLQIQRPPRLVGREAQLETLLASRKPVVLLSGEAGVGKSRLLEEVAADAAGARCLEGLQSVPFQAVCDLVRAALRRGWDPALLGDYREDLARLVPETLPGGPVAPAEPITARTRLLEALRRCLESAYGRADSGSPAAAAVKGRFHLTLDDLQWADEDTLELLTLLASHGTMRILGTFRRYETTPPLERTLAALRSAGHLQLVELEPLDEEQLRQLMASLMGADEGPERFTRWLHGNTAGNVMFALETLKALFENGALTADTRGWYSELDAITRDYSELEAPSAISDVILRRIERLSQPEVRTLQAAAVVGTGFSPTLLAQLLESSEWEQQDALEALERSGMIQGERFRHDLIRQAVYDALTLSRRKLLHSRAARVLEPGSRKLLDPESWIVLCEHLLAAGDQLGAARAVGRASADLAEMGLLEESRSLLEGVLNRLTNAEDTELAGLDPAAVAHVKAGVAHCLLELGELTLAAEALEEALRGPHTPELQAGALVTRARLHMRTGRLVQAGEDAQRGLELARRAGDRLLELNASSTLAESLYHLGQVERAKEIVEANVTALRSEDLPVALMAQLASLGAILDRLGQHEAALVVHEEAVQRARATGARQQFVNAALNLMECYRDLGRTEEALAMGEEALSLGEVDGANVLRNNLASLLLELGRLEAAEKYMLVNARCADPTLRVLAWTRLVRIYVHRGDAERLSGALDATLEQAPMTEYPVARIAAALCLAEHGTEAQRRRARTLVSHLEPDELPEPHRGDLLRLLSAAGST